jgi:hypothetical protein
VLRRADKLKAELPDKAGARADLAAVREAVSTRCLIDFPISRLPISKQAT